MKESDGFTLIEMVVVVSVTLIFMGMTLAYNRGSETNIALFTDEAKVVAALERAKSFALQRRSDDLSDNACGFGVFFKGPKAFVIFKDMDTTPGDLADCTGNQNYDTGEEIETLTLDRRIVFNPVRSEPVIFLSPYLEVLKYNDLITLQVEDDASKKIDITVDSAGVVSAS